MAEGMTEEMVLMQEKRNTGTTTATEGYDGTSWSTRPNMSTAASNRSGFNSAGNSAALAAGPSSSTEEFSGDTASLNVKTLTQS